MVENRMIQTDRPPFAALRQSMETFLEFKNQLALAAGAFFGWTFGWSPLFPLVLAFIAFDVFSAWIAAGATSQISAEDGRKGWYRKAGKLLLIVMFRAIDVIGIARVSAAGGNQGSEILRLLGITNGVEIAPFMCAYLIALEFISVCENLDRAGATPRWLNVIARRLKSHIESDDIGARDPNQPPASSSAGVK